MDGNGRWATAQGLSRSRGHIAGARRAFELIEYLSRSEIETLSLFAFSCENWQRPPSEVQLLMRLLAYALEERARDLAGWGVRLRVIGAREGLPAAVVAAIARVEAMTCRGSALELVLAVNYSGQWDICQAVQRGGPTPEAIARNLSCGNPDLIIRTGGETRLSNFFLWQAAYAELHFSDLFWPEFTAADLEHHLVKYRATDRRYGRVACQTRS